MNLSRIFKLLFTSFLGQGISVISQLLIPPFFLSIFGLEVYGEWIALSASVNYLGTLYYGVQTYATNEMTILYNRGDEGGAKAIQGSACRLLISMALCFAAVGLIVFVIPVSSVLKLRHESNFVAGLTLYLLILQFVVNMMFNLLANSYMVVGKLHRGNYWAKRPTAVQRSRRGPGVVPSCDLPRTRDDSVGVAGHLQSCDSLGCSAHCAGSGTIPAPWELEASRHHSEAERSLRPDCGSRLPHMAGASADYSTSSGAGCGGQLCAGANRLSNVAADTCHRQLYDRAGHYAALRQR